jgi:hypothetical protein
MQRVAIKPTRRPATAPPLKMRSLTLRRIGTVTQDHGRNQFGICRHSLLEKGLLPRIEMRHCFSLDPEQFFRSKWHSMCFIKRTLPDVPFCMCFTSEIESSERENI